jgi:hypothetical protein
VYVTDFVSSRGSDEAATLLLANGEGSESVQ